MFDAAGLLSSPPLQPCQLRGGEAADAERGRVRRAERDRQPRRSRRLSALLQSSPGPRPIWAAGLGLSSQPRSLSVRPVRASVLRGSVRLFVRALCAVNASRRSADLASRRFPVCLGCAATGAVGRQRVLARPPPRRPPPSLCWVLGAEDRCSESSDSDGVRPRRRSLCESSFV